MLPTILTALFNAVLLSGHIPAPFRHGLNIPVPKGHNKDLSKPSNYRGITLLSVFGKVFEKVLLHRLTDQSQVNLLQQSYRQLTEYGDLLKNGKCIRAEIPLFN